MNERREEVSRDVHGDENWQILCPQQHGRDTSKVSCDKWCSTLKCFLSSYLRFIQSPHRQDSILKIAQYSLWLLSKFYGNKVTRNNTSLRVADSLVKLSSEISWARYVNRFFGLPGIINDLDSRNWASDNSCKRLGQAMTWTMIFFYPLEHMAYISWKAPHLLFRGRVGGYCSSSSHLASRASAWSCRFWLSYLVLDIFRCMLSLREKPRQPSELKLARSRSDDDSHKLKNGEICKEGPKQDEASSSSSKNNVVSVRTEHLQIVRNILYVLPAIQWSLPNWDTQPCLPGDLVNGLCWLESVVGLYQGVHNFRQT